MIGSAEIESELVLANARLGDAAGVVDRRVGVQLVVLDFVEGLPAERVGAALGDELNLHRALGAAVRREPGH